MMKGFQVSRRRLLAAIGATGAASAGAGVGTFAYFQDTESSSGNTVNSGTLNLDIKDGGDPKYTLSTTAPGSGIPGSVTLTVFNTGSIRGDHVEFGFDNTTVEDENGNLDEDNDGTPEETSDPSPNPDADDSAGGDMSKYVKVEQLKYSVDTDGDGNQESGETVFLVNNGAAVDSHGGSTIQKVDQGKSFISLYDLADSSNDAVLDQFTPPMANTTQNSTGVGRFDISVSLHKSTPNKFQGDVVKTDITFALHQDSSQDI